MGSSVVRYGRHVRSGTTAALLAGLLISAGATPSPADTRYRNFDCVWKSGPEYRFTIAGNHRKATGYFLEGFGTTCVFTKRWVARLAKEPWRGTNKPVPHGPPGWRCRSDRHATTKPESVSTGNCQNIKDPRRVFLWEPFGESQPVEPPPSPPPSEPPSEPDQPA